MRSAADVVAAVMRGYGIDRSVREHRIVTHWADVVGEKIAGRTWPDGLREGVLWIRVQNSAWMHQLSFLKGQIIARANEIVGNPPLVVDIRLHLGARKQVDADDTVAALARHIERAPRPFRKDFVGATPQQAQQIRAETDRVEDAELRAAIAELRLKVGV